MRLIVSLYVHYLSCQILIQPLTMRFAIKKTHFFRFCGACKYVGLKRSC